MPLLPLLGTGWERSCLLFSRCLMVCQNLFEADQTSQRTCPNSNKTIKTLSCAQILKPPPLLLSLQVIVDLKGSECTWSYQTPPSSPSTTVSRKSSMCRLVTMATDTAHPLNKPPRQAGTADLVSCLYCTASLWSRGGTAAFNGT